MVKYSRNKQKVSHVVKSGEAWKAFQSQPSSYIYIYIPQHFVVKTKSSLGWGGLLGKDEFHFKNPYFTNLNSSDL